MTAKRQFGGMGFSLLEQASASAGSFVFFLLAARMLGVSDFGQLALHLVPAQIAHGIAVQWLLLPITTTPGSRLPRQHLIAVSRRLAIHAATMPIFATVYGLAAGVEGTLVVFAGLVTLLGVALVLFDLVRYFAIRLEHVKRQVAANVGRWFLSLWILAVGSEWLQDGTTLGVTAFVAGLGTGIAVCGATVLRELLADFQKPTEKVIDQRPVDARAFLSLGIANALFSIISTIVLARASVAGFGALQAFRSLVNWAPLLLQYMETHFASHMARRSQTTFIDGRWIAAFILVTLLGELAILILGDWILQVTVGPDYVGFTWLFAVMFALVMLQSYTRTVGIEVRLNGALRTMWIQVLVLCSSAATIVCAQSALETGLTFNAMVAIMFGVATLQAIAMVVGLKSHLAKTTERD